MGYENTPVSNHADYKVKVYKETASGGTTQVFIPARVVGTTVTPYTDTDPIVVTAGPSTFTTTTNASITVTTSATKQTILAANANRKFASVSLQGTAVVHIELSDNAASTTRYWAALVTQYDYLPIPDGYTGVVTAISITSSSAIVVKEG